MSTVRPVPWPGSRRRPSAPRRWQRGLSLVEMMVGAVIGLIVLAGATRLFVDHVDMNRRAMLEVRLHQDIRAAAELMARGLRRAGYWQGALGAGDAAGAGNPYRHIVSSVLPTGQTTYSHSRGPEDSLAGPNETGGFRQVNGSLQMLIGGDWQSLTDTAVVQVTRLIVTPDLDTVPLGHLCTPACSAAQADCPRLHMRRYHIALTARSASDPSLSRELHTTVRVRNDDLGTARCPAQ